MAHNLGAVVIGRNEGARLGLALDSVLAAGLRPVYVDSASDDDSIEIAKSRNLQIVSLDSGSMLSAARARNAGMRALADTGEGPPFAMLLDGDCILASGFATRALEAIGEDDRIAVVVGHLHEAKRGTSIYERMSAHEWSSQVGDITNFGDLGGIMMVRCSAFTAVGGFNAMMIAGEDSEFGVRLALNGYRITKIDAIMATHENGVTHFHQWWRRSVRAGHALADRYARNGRTRFKDCRRELGSTLLWGGLMPTFVLTLAVATGGWSLLCLLLYSVIAYRMFDRARRDGMTVREAALLACFGLVAKFANFYGVVRYAISRLKGRFVLIEYKHQQSTVSHQ